MANEAELVDLHDKNKNLKVYPEFSFNCHIILGFSFYLEELLKLFAEQLLHMICVQY